MTIFLNDPNAHNALNDLNDSNVFKENFMKVLCVTLLALVLAGGIAAPAATGEEPIAITVATDATWPPMEMVDENKNIIGFDIDFMNAVAKEAGLVVTYKNTAWDGIFAGIALGKYDAIVSSVTILKERNKMMDFSIPYMKAGQVLIVPKECDNVTVLADLAEGSKVGAQFGTTGSFEIKKIEGLELKAYADIGLAFEDMVVGRIDAVVCDTPAAENYALKRHQYADRFKIVGQPFTEEYYGIAVRKGNKRLLDLINRGIRAVKEKGILAELEEKWLR